MREIFSGVWEEDHELLTQNLVPGKRVYNERLRRIGGKEYRTWNPYRSKLAAALKKGLRTFPFAKNVKVLYLGASTGTTVSHLSDIVIEGEVYAVEISPQAMKSLLAVAEHRGNIIPIHGDARKPHEYKEVGKVDVIYQDVAQPDQDEILIANAKMFLKKDGIAMIAIKSQSIDVTLEPKEVFERVLKKLAEHFEILEMIKLEPFDKDHLFVVLRFKG
ncbi:MAG: fibrillarin-like rRNA/tRNA 2'-O-methyltransferase [Candidatus Bilamarchaeaceae archaeon]